MFFSNIYTLFNFPLHSSKGYHLICSSWFHHPNKLRVSTEVIRRRTGCWSYPAWPLFWRFMCSRRRIVDIGR